MSANADLPKIDEVIDEAVDDDEEGCAEFNEQKKKQNWK